MVAETEQNFRTLFASAFCSPPICKPRSTSLCTCPRLPNTSMIYWQLYPRAVIHSTNGWYFMNLDVKQVSKYRSNAQPISKMVSDFLAWLMKTMSGVFGMSTVGCYQYNYDQTSSISQCCAYTCVLFCPVLV